MLTGVRCQVSGAATITSQALRADSAEVQLVAGATQRTRPAAPPSPMLADRMMVAGAEAKQTSEEAVGETHVYQLPGRLTIEPNVPVATALLPLSSAPVTEDVMVVVVTPGRGWTGQPPEQGRVPVQV